MKSIRFLAFITGIIIMSCSGNQGSIELKGKVLDEKTKIAIPGRKILIQSYESGDDKLASVYIGEFSTDSTGQFDYFLKNDNRYYIYDFNIVGDSSYAFTSKRLGLGDFYNYGQYLTFEVSKLTDLKIAIERKTRVPVNETLYLSWISDEKDGKEIYPYTVKNYGTRDPVNSRKVSLKWVGTNVKSTINTKVFADKETIVRWELHTDWDVQKFSDTILCKRDVFNCVYFYY